MRNKNPRIIYIYTLYIVTKIKNKKPKIVNVNVNSIKKKSLQFRLNLFTSSIDLMSIGKSLTFPSIGAMAEKALKPYVFKL